MVNYSCDVIETLNLALLLNKQMHVMFFVHIVVNELSFKFNAQYTYLIEKQG